MSEKIIKKLIAIDLACEDGCFIANGGLEHWKRAEQDWKETETGLRGLLQQYLQRHCQQSDFEGMGGLCECSLCLETRKVLG